MDSSQPEQAQQGSRLAWLGEASALALGASLIASLPTAWRTSAAGGSALDGLLVGLAVWLILLLPLALLRRRAARGWRGVLGADPPGDLLHGLALWAGSSVLLLAILGALLKATTHHRALGGATFGVFGVAAVGAAAILAVRLLAFGQRLRDRGVSARAIGGAAVALALLPPLIVAILAARQRAVLGPYGSAAVAAIVDVLLGMAAFSVTLVHELPKALRKAARLAAFPLCIALVGIGFARVEWSSGVGTAVRSGGGVPAAALWLLQTWTDRDGDGVGAHFGGFDCDEGDPSRHPGASDPVGDGSDTDCDGRDGRSVVELAAAPMIPGLPPSTAAATAASTGAVVLASTTAAPAAEPGAAAGVHGAPERPDIVLVTMDTVRASITSAYGYERDTTPALVALAKRGMLFAHAYAIGSSTQRAIAPLVTGLPLSRTRRSADDWPTFLDDNDMVAERLKRAGYATAAVTSFTWLRQDRGFHQGFDVFDESAFRAEHPEHSTTGVEAVKAARQAYAKLQAGTAPLFLWVHLFDGHQKYLEHAGLDFGAGDLGRYAGEVAFVDQRLGELWRMVGDGPRASKTLWIVHGSHGEAFGEHDKRGHGDEIYDETARVPLVIAAPWSEPGRYDADAVSTLDIAPTLLDYAGAPRDGVVGVSLRRAVAGANSFEREPVTIYAPRRVGVVDWPFKLLVKRRAQGRDRLLLFNLGADPDERRDVSADHAEVLRRLDELRQAAEAS